MECRTAARGCVDCKLKLADGVVEHFAPLRERREDIPGLLSYFLRAEAKRLDAYTLGHIPYTVGLDGIIEEGMDEIAHVEEICWEFADFDRQQDPPSDWLDCQDGEFRLARPGEWAELIDDAAASDGDSLGGVVSAVCRGVPAGWGEPVFDKLEAKLAQAMLSLPAKAAPLTSSTLSSTTAAPPARRPQMRASTKIKLASISAPTTFRRFRSSKWSLHHPCQKSLNDDPGRGWRA